MKELNDCTTERLSLLTDSRALTDPANTLFFALRTSADDGHRYVGDLYSRGVRRFVVEPTFDPSPYPEADFTFAESPLEELRRMGGENRRRFTLPVIAITGSRGKTMVKEWLYQLLRPDYDIVRSPRSYNSQIGVPLSLWEINGSSTLGIFEAGVSRQGEMDSLQRLILPDIVVLTNVGADHAEGFGSLSSKAAEKLLLAREARVVVAGIDDPVVRGALASLPASVERVGWSFSDSAAPLLINESTLAGGGTRLTYRLRRGDAPEVSGAVEIPFSRRWEIENAVSALAVMLTAGVAADEIGRRMSALESVGTRLQVSEGVNRCMLIHDDYTCDLHSLLPALDFVKRRQTPGSRLTVVLSDVMTENLTAAETYERIARIMAQKGVERMIGVGREISAHARLFPAGSRFFPSTAEAMEALSPSDFSSEIVLVKGAPGFGFTSLVHKLEARTHETVLEVNLDAMTDNYNFFRSALRPETGLVAMVKASGYGAGSYELAKTLQAKGAAYLAVAVLDEGVDLRKAGITMPIMVLNPKVLNYGELFANNLEPEIFSFDILEEIIAEAGKFGVTGYPIHIKLDTGMHRLGFLESDLDRLIERLQGQKEVKVASVFSHLATADCLDMDDYTTMQLRLFERCSSRIVGAFPYKVKRHVLNSAGILRFPEYQYDMVRLGIGLYGIPVINDGSEDGLRPVSTLRSVIISIKEWEAGTTIGYGRRGVLKRRSLVATVPVGYADGVNRHMGCGRCSFDVNGVKAPILGSICMDICMIDVTDVPGVKVGDSVVIFGPENPVTDLARSLDTIPYELLTAVSPRVRRIYYRES